MLRAFPDVIALLPFLNPAHADPTASVRVGPLDNAGAGAEPLSRTADVLGRHAPAPDAAP